MTWLNGGKRIAAACAGIAAVALVSAVVAGRAPSAAKNLIVNGTAEQGEASPNGSDVVADIPGWSRKGGFTVVAHGATDFPGVQAASAMGGGENFFAGGPRERGLSNGRGRRYSRAISAATAARTIR